MPSLRHSSAFAEYARTPSPHPLGRLRHTRRRTRGYLSFISRVSPVYLRESLAAFAVCISDASSAADPEAKAGGQDKGEAPYLNYNENTIMDFRLLWIRPRPRTSPSSRRWSAPPRGGWGWVSRWATAIIPTTDWATFDLGAAGPIARARVASSPVRIATLVRRGHGRLGAWAAAKLPPTAGFGPRHNACGVIVKAHLQKLGSHGAEAAARRRGGSAPRSSLPWSAIGTCSRTARRRRFRTRGHLCGGT